jgi:outer membrane protein OmpA-like peptidoglycan-associated protein
VPTRQAHVTDMGRCRSGCVGLALWLGLFAGVAPSLAGAQDSVAGGSADVEASLGGPAASDPWQKERWFLGAYWRSLWIPTYILKPFVDRAPKITSNGFGVVASHRSKSGFTIEFGLGYMPYAFEGAFVQEGAQIEETEWWKSDLALWHATASFMWGIDFHRMVGIDIGLGLDLGIFSGGIERDEAYVDTSTGTFKACDGPLMPATVGPNGVPFCDQPMLNGMPVDQLDSSQEGEHYDVQQERIPPVMLVPMLPHVALRFHPHPAVMLKAEFAFGIAQLVAGASVHVALTGYPKRAPAPPPPPPPEPEGPIPGRVLGKVLEEGGELGVAAASVKLLGSDRPSVTSDAHGLFVVDALAPGMARFSVSHPDYHGTDCEVDVPAMGGDVALHCHVQLAPRFGFVSGSVVDDADRPITGARVVLMGPNARELTSNAEGAFAAPDLPPGQYRIRVEADGFLLRMAEEEVIAGETSMPRIVLSPKAKSTLVKVSREEIVITQQVNFKLNSAEIGGSSDALMAEIADVLNRYEYIELVEIQGHSDDKGKRDYNVQLSQARAESVRQRLIQSGVAPQRLEARGYGPDQPLVPNKNAASRAKNRRVQFIIKQQTLNAGE